MNSLLLPGVALGLAAVPASLFLINLAIYRRTQKLTGVTPPLPRVSVLIPARNEENSIGAAVESVLANREVDLEVIVLDDRSEDRTAEIVRALAQRDPRVRLVSGMPLPAGWCGKQFACHTLAGHARHDWLVFMDADVRLQPDALGRMVQFMKANGAALGSGVPRQITETFLERLLLPLIHFVLLGFLPMWRMRESTKPGYAAGCGQLFIAQREAYEAVGGHAMVKASLHDGIKLPRAFRRAGFRTDLFDATDLAACRMYRNAGEVWRGLGKNATEGLGSPQLIGPMTSLLFGGQVLPFVLLPLAVARGGVFLALTLAAMVLAWLPRFAAAKPFQQPLLGALLHPLGVTLLLVIQWQALFRKLTGAPMNWKGRAYGPPVAAPSWVRFAKRTAAISLAISLLGLAMVALRGDNAPKPVVAATPCAPVKLADQFEKDHELTFPRAKPVVLLLADKEGSEQIDAWVTALKARLGADAELFGIADVGSVPRLLRGRVRSSFKKTFPYPVMLDWSGEISARFQPVPKQTTVLAVATDGSILRRTNGVVNDAAIADLATALKLPVKR
jgi:hypothetical protein